MPNRTPSQPDATHPATLQSAVLHLTDRMSGAATYSDAAVVAEEVLHSEHGLLERLRGFFEAAAEQANAVEDIEGWQLADRFSDTAAQLGELVEELADSADELRALGPPAPRWQPDAAVRRSDAAHRTVATGPTPAATSSIAPAPAPGTRRPR